jgi:hypothetical protein
LQLSPADEKKDWLLEIPADVRMMIFEYVITDPCSPPEPSQAFTTKKTQNIYKEFLGVWFSRTALRMYSNWDFLG